MPRSSGAAPSARDRLEALISAVFARAHVRSCVTHFDEMLQAFQKSDWEKSIGRGGKFIEAALKALALHIGQTLPPARQFKAGKVVQDLKALGVGTYNDAVRVTIPRACEFVYDIASNRGARHDPSEVNPNEQDAHAVLSTVSWVLAELLRYAQKGSVTPDETRELVAGLVQRRYPMIEEVEGRTYFHIDDVSARSVGLLALWSRHPARLTRDNLREIITRHRFSRAAAETAISRLLPVVDEDEHGGFRLLQPGLAEAEKIIEDAHRG